MARGLRGESLGFLKVFSNLSEARLLIPLEVIRSLWFRAKERTKSGEYVLAVVQGLLSHVRLGFRHER